MLQLVLYIAAAILLALAAVGVATSRVNLLAAGLLCWLLGYAFAPMLG